MSIAFAEGPFEALYDHRRGFLDILSGYYQRADDDERRFVGGLIDRVCRDSNCFDRKKESGAEDIAASVFLMRPQDDRALFMWHKRIGRWTQPGGHADGESDIYRVVMHELEEETGVAITQLLDPIPFEIYQFDYPESVFGYQKSIVNLFFFAMLPPGQKPRIMEPEKCGELRWASPDEAIEMIRCVPHDGYGRLLQKWQNQIARTILSR